MEIKIVDGDLLEQKVDVIVNAWNRNIIPWWLLLPQGVSGAIKRFGGTQPFRELARHGSMPLGTAVETSAGRLPYRAIIHVAGINLLWRSSVRSIQDSVRNAMSIAIDRRYSSIAIPLIGAGSGGGRPEEVHTLIQNALAEIEYDGCVTIVRYKKPTTQ